MRLVSGGVINILRPHQLISVTFMPSAISPSPLLNLKINFPLFFLTAILGVMPKGFGFLIDIDMDPPKAKNKASTIP